MRGFKSKTLVNPTPMIFWQRIKTVVITAILNTRTPPRLIRLRLAV